MKALLILLLAAPLSAQRAPSDPLPDAARAGRKILARGRLQSATDSLLMLEADLRDALMMPDAFGRAAAGIDRALERASAMETDISGSAAPDASDYARWVSNAASSVEWLKRAEKKTSDSAFLNKADSLLSTLKRLAQAVEARYGADLVKPLSKALAK